MQYQPDRKQLRSFGLIVGAGFTVIGLWPVAFRGDAPRWWALAIALALAAGALLAPSLLRHPFRGWMAVGAVLGWINTRIILGLVYYLLIVPMGLVMRMTGKDPMRRRLEPGVDTYRIPRTKRPASHMHRQY